jgi:hypothetical protein
MLRISVIAALLIVGPSAAFASEEKSEAWCEVRIYEVDPDENKSDVATIDDRVFYRELRKRLEGLPEAEANREFPFGGYHGLGILFQGERCDDPAHFEIYRGVVKRMSDFKFRKDAQNAERFVFEYAKDLPGWSLGDDPWMLYVSDDGRCGLRATAWLYSGMPDPMVTISAREEILELASRLENLPPAGSIGKGEFGDIKIWLISPCAPFPKSVRIQGDVIHILEESGRRHILRDTKGLGDAMREHLGLGR